MSVSEIASGIVEALTSAFTSMVSVIPNAIKDTFTNLFFTTNGETQTISTFAIVMLVFGGVALAFGITKLVYHLVRSKIG